MKYPPKITYPLKIDGWKMKVPFQNGPFSRDMLISEVNTLEKNMTT